MKDALAALTKLARHKPSLTASCDVLSAMLPALFEEPVLESVPVADVALAQEKTAAGVPLLRGEQVVFEPRSLRHRWLSVCQAVGRENDAAHAVAVALDALDPSLLLAHVLAGRTEDVHSRADILGLDPALTATIFRLTSLPVLAKLAAAWEPLRRSWNHGHCPTCGSWPVLGEFRGLEQIRYLRCGLCASDWQFSRLRCPFCDNRDHNLLGYLHVEQEETRCRAATCDACQGYVKMVFTLGALSAPELLVSDLATLHLDLAASERGYVGA